MPLQQTTADIESTYCEPALDTHLVLWKHHSNQKCRAGLSLAALALA